MGHSQKTPITPSPCRRRAVILLGLFLLPMLLVSLLCAAPVSQARGPLAAGTLSSFIYLPLIRKDAVVSFPPEADAWIEEVNPTRNEGASPMLRVDAGTPTQVNHLVSYLRFKVTGVPGTITRARLRLYAQTGTVSGPMVSATGNAWSENEITWNNQPPSSGNTLIGSLGVITAATWIEFDVTPVVVGNGAYSFVLVTGSTDGVTFSSREGLFPPALVVTFQDVVEPTSTATPTSTASAP